MGDKLIEITDAMIADAKACGHHCGCTECGLIKIRLSDSGNCISVIAAALESERAKGPGVWTDAPDWAQLADIRWCNRAKTYGEWRTESYTRNATPRLRAESIIGSKGEKLDGDEWERAVAAVERELG